MTRQIRSLPALLSLAIAGAASADIIGVGGAVVLRDPPRDISNGLWTSDTEIRGWFERQTTLQASLQLDHVNVGRVDDSSLLVPGTLDAGTVLQSYMVRLDPATGGSHMLSGFVVFDTPILGVLQDRPTLGGTDALLGRPDTLYNTNNNRGMELGAGGGIEFFEISADRLRLDFTMLVTDGPTDDIRIVTTIPAPGGAVVALAGLSFRSRRNRRPSIAPQA